MAKKAAQLAGEAHAPARIVIVDPRRTVTVNACEAAAGKDNVLHLAIKSGTDLALFNALLTHIADQGWLDRAFIDAQTAGFDEALAANRTKPRGCRGDHRPAASRSARRRVDRRAQGRRAGAGPSSATRRG